MDEAMKGSYLMEGGGVSPHPPPRIVKDNARMFKSFQELVYDVIRCKLKI
jgi:hypothetical protein